MKQRNIAILLGMTAITVFAWIGFEIYRTGRAKITPPVMQQITPLDPKIDTQLLTILENRKVFSTIRPTNPSPVITPSPSPEPNLQPVIATSSPIASPGAR